jgi:hypothetical protein
VSTKTLPPSQALSRTEAAIYPGISASEFDEPVDEQASLLYVGVSLNAVARLSAHNRDSHWFNRIARVEVERHPTREAALAAELEAIRTEKPLHNIAGRVAA